jgi:alkylation response protein AidB-like acyl-CoA dehydrogenase
MHVHLTEQQQLLRQSVREFAEREIRPHVREWDDAQHFPMELLPALGALGLMGIQFDEAYGGAGMSAVEYCICIEELARVDPSIALSVAAHNGLGAAHVAMFGSEAQKQRFLVPMTTGRVVSAWGLTEPGSGSDAAAMRTTAVRDGDGWILNGSKAFITHGQSAQTMVAMAVTDREKGARGISAFIIERGTPGFLVGKKEDKLGMRASETAEVIFQDCRIPADHLIGEAGEGFIQTLQVLDAGRIGIAALAVGLAQGAYETARQYASQRRQFGRSIDGFQSIRWKLLDTATRVESARLLTYRSAWMNDQGQRTTLESSMAKLFSSEAAVRAAEDAVQILGGYGFVKDYAAEKFFRDVKLTTIGEGTSEVQRLVIARQLLAA